MDLRRRLARLDQLTRPPVPEPQRPGPAAVRGGAAPDCDLAVVLREALGLAARETADGTLWSLEEVRPEVGAPPPRLPALTGLLPRVAPDAVGWDDLLFLDTETTGLAGGTGTLPFLVGLGWWRGGTFATRQLFLAGPGREAPLLAELADLAGRFRAVVTYNGAAFDLPLLRTRALLARRADPCAALAVWDLLPAARRLWGRDLQDCRQQTGEQCGGGCARGPGDIEGALIPAVYHAFLRDGEVGRLGDVLRHNRRDLAGMARLLAAMAGEMVALATGGRNWGGSPAGAWSRALICERRRERELAAAWAAALAVSATTDAIPAGGVLDAVRLLKRVADWSAVAQLLERGLAAWPDEPRLHYEAAVLYEHRLRDPERALVHARRLGDERRLTRLRARLGAR